MVEHHQFQQQLRNFVEWMAFCNQSLNLTSLFVQQVTSSTLVETPSGPIIFAAVNSKWTTSSFDSPLPSDTILASSNTLFKLPARSSFYAKRRTFFADSNFWLSQSVVQSMVQHLEW
jgi:hypothetical protein